MLKIPMCAKPPGLDTSRMQRGELSMLCYYGYTIMALKAVAYYGLSLDVISCNQNEKMNRTISTVVI